MAAGLATNPNGSGVNPDLLPLWPHPYPTAGLAGSKLYDKVLGRMNRPFGRNRLLKHFNGGNRDTIGKHPNINRTEGYRRIGIFHHMTLNIK
jgi:hypothetical protein